MAKLPAFDEWKRPWTAGEVDEEKLARLVYNLKVDVEKRDDKIAAKDEELNTLTSELDTVKASKASPDPEVQEELKALRTENRELKKNSDVTRPQDQKKIDRLEVALTLGLSAADAKRLVGETREELEEDAKVFAKDHGIELAGENEQEQEPERPKPTRAPLSTLRVSTESKGQTVGSNPAAARTTIDSIPL